MARSVRGSHWQQGHIGPKGKGGFEPPFFRLVMSRSTFAFRMFRPAVRPCRMVRHPAGPAAGGNAGQVTQNALSLASPLEPGQQAFGQVFAQPLQQAALGRHQAGAAHAGVLAGRVDAAIQCLPATGKLPAGLQAVKRSKGKLIIIDNADILLDDAMRSYIVLDGNNQYIIIGRNPTGLLLNIDEVYELQNENVDGITLFTLKKSF